MSGIINFKNDSFRASNAAFFWIAAELLKRIEREQKKYLSAETTHAFETAAAEKTDYLDLSAASPVELRTIKACLEGFITEVQSGIQPFFDVSARPAYLDLLMDLWGLIDRELKTSPTSANSTTA